MSRTIWLYALLCRDGSIYLGIAADVEARFRKHCAGQAALYTRLMRPLSRFAAQPFESRAQARRAEIRLKACSHFEKIDWATQWPWLEDSASHAPQSNDSGVGAPGAPNDP